MNDVIYIGEIPEEYCYARYSDGHIDLFKEANLSGVQTFYRIYMYDNSFQYEFLSTTFDTPVVATQVQVSNDYLYRRDMPSIMFMSIVYVAIIVLCFNLVSSIFKKGGILSGLL